MPPFSGNVMRFESSSLSADVQTVEIALPCTLPVSELTRLFQLILHALPKKPGVVVQFASAYADEGTSGIAFETAIVAATLGMRRILFIDTAPESCFAASALSAKIALPLDRLAATSRPATDAILQVEGTGLHYCLLSATGNKAGLAYFPLLQQFLETVSPLFDFVILASPALLTDAFGSGIAKLAEGTILVVEAERTRAPVAAETVRLIEAGGGKVLGTVLNKRKLYIPQWIYRMLYRGRGKAT